MSGNAQPTQEQAEQAFNLLYQSVHVPVFFAKLAEHGIYPSNDSEAATMLRIGNQIGQLEQVELAKQASQRSGWLDNAANELDRYLGVHPQFANAAVKQASDHFCGQDALLNAASILAPLQAATS